MDPEISEQLHEQIFQTYKHLQTILPKKILKMKVLKNQRYPITRPSIMQEIDNEILNKNKNYLSSAQKINIYYNENSKKRSIIPNLYKNTKIKTNKIDGEKTNSPETSKPMLNNTKRNISSFDNNEIITFKNFREKNMKMLGVKCDIKIKRHKGLYNSFSVNDIDMKKNIYLPKIIDRMKYSLPRNLRNNQGLILLGNNVNNIINKNKEIPFIVKKKTMPTDLFFYKLKKINNRNNINKKAINNNLKNNESININNFIHINSTSNATNKSENY